MMKSWDVAKETLEPSTPQILESAREPLVRGWKGQPIALSMQSLGGLNHLRVLI
jgi:hypothetical protein